jgi:hypothetical protein
VVLGSADADAELPPLSGKGDTTPVAPSSRRVGDLLVHRFVGSYAKSPLTLTERVVAREGDLIVVDYELEQGDRIDRLRVRLSARSERLVTVARLVDDREVPAELEDYQAFLARTNFAPDRNAGTLSADHETCLVGPREFDCEVAHYRVFVAGREAAMTVKKSESLGRDLSGEIVALDGTIIYRAELVEQARGRGEAADATAWR